jgi:hypothetical protein
MTWDVYSGSLIRIFPSRIKKRRFPVLFNLNHESSHILEAYFCYCHFSLVHAPFIFIGSSSLCGHILGPGRQRSEGDKRLGDNRRQKSSAARGQDAVAQKRRRRHWHFLPHPHKHWRPREQVWAAGDGRGDDCTAADVGNGGANTRSAAATTAAASHAAGEQHYTAARHHLGAAADGDGRLQLQPHSAAPASGGQQTKGGLWKVQGASGIDALSFKFTKTSSKPLSHRLPRVFIDLLLNTLQKLHFVGIAEAAVQLSRAFF